MYTTNNDNNGLVKVDWHQIRKNVKIVEPNFAKMVDDLNPDKTFPIYLAYIPYGDLKGDTVSTLLPGMDGDYFRITDPSTPKELLAHLGYSVNGSPFGMVLEKELEYFIDLKRNPIPWAIYRPGRFFSFGYHYSKDTNRSYFPNSVLAVASGARSAFMLANISSAVNHANLRRDFNVRTPKPKYLYNHWTIFKEIARSNVCNCNWRSCVLYFSEKWLLNLHNDPAWLILKNYLLEKSWNEYEYDRCRRYFDITFCLIQNKFNLKPNPYLADTARHLFTIALGDAPGFAPVCDDSALPLEHIQKAYHESYGLKKYFPTIMKPTRFIPEKGGNPVYYSLQNPSTFNFSPKSRKNFSMSVEMRELAHIMQTYINALLNYNIMGSDSAISDIAKNIEFTFYHNVADRHNIMQSSEKLAKADLRFSKKNHKYYSAAATFPEDSPFVRGCISIGQKC